MLMCLSLCSKAMLDSVVLGVVESSSDSAHDIVPFIFIVASGYDIITEVITTSIIYTHNRSSYCSGPGSLSYIDPFFGIMLSGIKILLHTCVENLMSKTYYVLLL